MQKKCLILNGSHSEITLIEAAKKLGFYVITSGNMPELVGHHYADEYIKADYSDKEAILQIVKDRAIDAIVGCANDFGTITASYVAEKMGWPGHDSYETTLLLHQKDLFKEYVAKAGIPSPVSVPFDSREDALAYIKTAEYPIIVKATDLTGGKGILKAENEAEAKAAIDNAFTRSRAKHIVIEPFLTGTQHSINVFIIDGKIAASVSCNSYSPINPYLIQTEVLPADDIEQYEEELHGIIDKMIDTLHLADGILTMQFIVHHQKPYIIEVMRRCLGNQYLTVARAVSGFPWEEALVRCETGMDCSGLKWEKPMAKGCGHHGIMATRNGVVKGYEIDPDIEKHIFQKIEILRPGEALNDYMNERVAYIYYTYDNRDEMIDAALHMNDRIKIFFEDDIGG